MSVAPPLSRRSLVQLGGLAVFDAGCKRRPELPVLGRLGAFALVDQGGRAVTERSLGGKVWAAAFMFTRCPTVCPRITRRMRELQRMTATERVPLLLVSFSVDPEHDTPEVLTRYARQHDADLETWSFLTGDLEVIRKTSLEGFKLALDGKAQPGAEHFGILHGSHLVLVDGQSQIRGYYRTSDDDALRQLMADVASLA